MENTCGEDWSSYYFRGIDKNFFFFNVIHKLVTFLKLTGCELAYQSKSEVFAEHPSATMLSVPRQGSATLPWP